jgi:oxygen-independent coproporphyrinogen-3 oxidase
MLTSLYLHIPFCSHICAYCDFHKELAKDSKKENYIKALNKEIAYYQDRYQNIKTVYIGGGTPSSLDLGLLESLLKTISQFVPLDQMVEYTIEANPDDITNEFVLLIKKYGINRISLGVQSFSDKHLAFIGRTHRENEICNAVNILKQHAFPNISIDLIFSLPDQTIDEVRKDLALCLSLDIEHISYYSLILEEKSILYHKLQKNKIMLNDEDIEGMLYIEVIDTLKAAGYHHYEISNFAKTGYESIHNQTYWRMDEYLGLGSGSHSQFDEKRWYHETNVSKYTNRILSDYYDVLIPYPFDQLGEALMLGLRLIDGVHIATMNDMYSCDIFEEYPALDAFIDQGLLEIKQGNLRFTKKGLLVGNIVFQTFVEVL